MPARFVCWGLRTNKSETCIVEKEQAFSLYQQMVRIRRFEEELYQLFLKRPMPGSMHQYIGEEAVAVGVCAHLTREDYVTSTHRGHGHCIAKGVDLNAIMAEMFAKKTGCCKGLGGSMHIADFSVGMLGANGIVGAGIPIATGAGWACQLRYPGRVSVVFFGEGAANEGAFHEGLNLASVWNLPVVFVCENNLYNFSVHYKKTMVLDNVADRAVAYGIPGRVVDGMDLVDGLSCRGRGHRARATGRRPDFAGVQDLSIYGPFALRAGGVSHQGRSGRVEEKGSASHVSASTYFEVPGIAGGFREDRCGRQARDQ